MFNIGLDVGGAGRRSTWCDCGCVKALVGAAEAQALVAESIAIEGGIPSGKIAEAEGLSLHAEAFNGIPRSGLPPHRPGHGHRHRPGRGGAQPGGSRSGPRAGHRPRRDGWRPSQAPTLRLAELGWCARRGRPISRCALPTRTGSTARSSVRSRGGRRARAGSRSGKGAPPSPAVRERQAHVELGRTLSSGAR